MSRNSATTAWKRTGLTLLWLCVAAILGATGAAAQPVAGNPAASPAELVNKLQAQITEAPDESVMDLIEALWAHGEAAIPAVTAGLARGDDRLSQSLIQVLVGIGGEASTSVLMGLVARGPSSDVARSAVGAIDNRWVRRPLTTEELGTLTTLVTQEKIFLAGSAARVLAKCTSVPADHRLAPIAFRFRSEILSPTVTELKGFTGSPRVFVLHPFLRAFSYLGASAVAELKRQREQASDNAELRKWLALALGMSGDDSIAAELRDMAVGEPDMDVRVVAIQAYAHSAGQAAVPALTSLLADTTEVEYRGCMPGPTRIRPIRDAARRELARLAREKSAAPK